MVLKGYDAIPMELKILLDRLLAAYHDTLRVERRHRLAQMGWSEEDYARGYKLEVCGSWEPSHHGHPGQLSLIDRAIVFLPALI